jgi:lipopolysaccharide export system permease protein
MAKTFRIPTLLYSYLATEMLAPFFASFIVMNSVFFLVKLIPFLNVVLELEISFVDFLRLFFYLFPNMFLYSIPMAAMMGVIISFTRLSSDTEILAFKASGISLYQMLPPVILVSAAIAILTGYFSAALIPKSEIAMKQLMFQVAKEKIDKGIKENQFTEALGDLVVYVDSIDKETGKWSNVWVSDMRGQVTPIITMAQFGSMEAQVDNMLVTIILENGSLHRPDSFRSQIIGFEKYTINIPLQPPTILDGEDVTKLDASALTMTQLSESIDKVGIDSKQRRDMQMHYHKRLVLPVGCFILSLLGMPLGLQAGPGKRAAGVPLGLAFFILYYILFTMGKNAAGDSELPVGPLLWLPNGVFLIITIYFIKQTAKEHPVIPIALKNLFLSFGERYISPILRKIKSIFRRKDDKSINETIFKNPATPIKYDKSSIEESMYLTEGTVHGNIKRHIFHVQGCELYYCKDCTIEFKNVLLAEKSGFEPCSACKILLDNLE